MKRIFTNILFLSLISVGILALTECEKDNEIKPNNVTVVEQPVTMTSTSRISAVPYKAYYVTDFNLICGNATEENRF